MIKQGILRRVDMVDAVAKLLTGTSFPWFWHKNQVYEDNPNLTSHGGLRHIYYNDGQEKSTGLFVAMDILNAILEQEQIKYKSLYRVQSNLVQNINISDEAVENSWHVDYDAPNHLVVLYYVITSDGNTLIKDGNKILQTEPVAGHYVIFDSTLLHRATMPKRHDIRVVTNYVIEI